MTPSRNKFLTRRNFIRSLMVTAPLAACADAKFIEPTWLKVRRVRVGSGSPVCRFVHFTDLHHKGDRKYLESVVAAINSLGPDFVCFTGDIIEEEQHLPEALELLAGIKAPLFGVPGNHDYWSGVDFGDIAPAFERQGGRWLLDQQQELAGGKINIIGLSCENAGRPVPLPKPGAKNILLMHYPAWAKKLGDQKYDLMLAGHSHGGQVRIPFYGPVVTPFGVDEYDLGFFETPAGPLYVGSGVGWFFLNVRLNCRPEITVIEI